MGAESKKLVSLREIEGAVSPHQRQIESALALRKEALEYIRDAAGLAKYIGGRTVLLGVGEDWALSKRIFPGVNVYFAFIRGDEEFPSNLKVFFSGRKIGDMKGEDLAGFVILYANHMLRYVRETVSGVKLPEVCYRV
jgi:hypothetical protein